MKHMVRIRAGRLTAWMGSFTALSIWISSFLLLSVVMPARMMEVISTGMSTISPTGVAYASSKLPGSTSTSFHQEKLTEEQIHQLMEDRRMVFSPHLQSGQVSNLRLTKTYFHENTYYILVTYDLDGRPRGAFSKIIKDENLKAWRLGPTASGFLDFDRGFEAFVLPESMKDGMPPTKTCIGVFVNNSNISKLRVRQISDGGRTVKTTYIPVDNTRKVCTVLDGFGSIQIDGLNRENHVLYGWM